MVINCGSIKQLLIEHLASSVDVNQVRDMCVATIPFVTIDSRWVDVFIEPRAKDFFLVHDAGKAVNEIILHGIKLTSSVDKNLGLIAGRFGVAYTDEMFQTGVKINKLADRVYAIGMCSALAMTQLLDHVPMIEEESLQDHIAVALRQWNKGSLAQIERDKKVAGDLKQHHFDFLVTPRNHAPVSITIVNPTAGALSAAERFGFKTKDLAQYPDWQHVAVQAKSEVWSQEAKRIVDRCANAVIEAPSGAPPTYQAISDALDRIAA